MSLTNFRSILIFAGCVVGTRNILYGFYFFLGGVLFFVHYNGECWYLYFRWGILSELGKTSHLFYKFITVVSTICSGPGRFFQVSK